MLDLGLSLLDCVGISSQHLAFEHCPNDPVPVSCEEGYEKTQASFVVEEDAEEPWHVLRPGKPLDNMWLKVSCAPDTSF